MNIKSMTPVMGDQNSENGKLNSYLLEQRIINLTGEINQQSSASIITQLLYLDSINQEPINMYIQSPGGCIASALAIYDSMNHIKSKVKTYCVGLVASAATLIFAAGSKGERYCLKHSKMLIHQPRLYTSEGYEKYYDIQNKNENIEKCYKELEVIYKTITYKKINDAQLTHFLGREQVLNASEIIKHGFGDKIIGLKNGENNE